MVSDTPTEGRCNAEIDSGYCEGWQMDNGRCHKHGGRNEDDDRDAGGAPEGNINSISHGLYAETNKFYQTIMSDKERALCDEIFQDYCTQFREKHGDPHTGEQARLFEVSVNHVKIIHSDNWATDKPESLESGNPMVDKGERFNTEGVPYQEYTETVVLKGQTRLRNSDRQWLKDMGLLQDPESKKADNMEGLAEMWASELED